MKGVILAGGSGSRLYPITKSVSKQLMPIYDKPMIYYPLSVLMMADIKEILVITTPQDKNLFINLLGNGSQFGISIEYAIQNEPKGLAEAFIIGKSFISDDDVCLILGDNIFFGHGLPEILQNAKDKIKDGLSTIFGYHVNDPERYGVVEFDKKGIATSIEEKPEIPKSNFAVTGMYFYTNDVVEKVLMISPSNRGELEITDINKLYLKENSLNVEMMGRGFAWLDTGTHESLLEASTFIETIERRQGLKIACLEEIAYSRKFIKKEKFIELAQLYKNNQYGRYLIQRLNEK